MVYRQEINSNPGWKKVYPLFEKQSVTMSNKSHVPLPSLPYDKYMKTLAFFHLHMFFIIESEKAHNNSFNHSSQFRFRLETDPEATFYLLRQVREARITPQAPRIFRLDLLVKTHRLRWTNYRS